MPTCTIASAEVLDLVDSLGRAGVHLESALPLAGMQMEEIASGSPTEAAALVRLFEVAEETTGDRRIGLHAAEDAQPRGPLAHLMMSCSTLEDALMRCRRFGPLLGTTVRLDMEATPDRMALVYHYGNAELDASRHVVDYSLMSTLRAVQRAIGETSGRIGEVHFEREGDGSIEDYERAFGCRVRFGQADNRLWIPRRLTDLTPRMSNPRIADQLEKFAEALLPSTVVPSSFREQVAQATRTFLGSGIRADRRLIGKNLGVSERTLQRRLIEEGTSFREVREDVLWELAEALVSDGQLKLEAIALSVGFADAAAFSKAFKRRTGQSPNEYRRAVGALGRDS